MYFIRAVSDFILLMVKTREPGIILNRYVIPRLRIIFTEIYLVNLFFFTKKKKILMNFLELHWRGIKQVLNWRVFRDFGQICDILCFMKNNDFHSVWEFSARVFFFKRNFLFQAQMNFVRNLIFQSLIQLAKHKK